MKNRLILPLLIALSSFMFAQTYQINVIEKNGLRQSFDILKLNKVTFSGVSGSLLSLVYPPDKAAEVSVTPILKWSKIDNIKYSLQVSINQDMSSPVIDKVNLSDNTYQIIGGLKGLTKYYWRIKNESDGMWTTTFSFTTGMPYIFPPQVPKSFAVVSSKPNTLKLIIKPDPLVQSYTVFLSRDGITFNNSISLLPENMEIDNLTDDSLYYIRLSAVNSGGSSAVSEVLAGTPSSFQKSKIILVHSFDRKSSGNTFDFIRFHALALTNNRQTFCSSTNEAITDNLISLRDYSIADYILGDESTIDETLSKGEQEKLKDFLINGGSLFISGSEIAWDLDYKGNSEDKYFMFNFLKSQFIADSPLNQKGLYYEAAGLDNSIFATVSDISFDNGKQGTINVAYPDAIKPLSGAKSCLKYTNVDTSQGTAGIFFDGLFPNGLSSGKLVYLSFPFETIYPQEKRDLVMQKAVSFFLNITAQDEAKPVLAAADFILYQNYPNPFNPATRIKYSIARQSRVKLTIFDTLGKEIITLTEDVKNPGVYEEELDMGTLPSGIYFYRLAADGFTDVKKLSLVK